MSCCTEPDVSHDTSKSTAKCANCGFGWTFKIHGKGRKRSKKPRWGPDWFCSDDYDRKWRIRDYDRHEVVGTRSKGYAKEYVIGCPKSSTMFTADAKNPPDEVYCPDCDRMGMLGPMVNRWREREGSRG